MAATVGSQLPCVHCHAQWQRKDHGPHIKFHQPNHIKFHRLIRSLACLVGLIDSIEIDWIGLPLNSDQARSSPHGHQTEHQLDAIPSWDQKGWASLERHKFTGDSLEKHLAPWDAANQLNQRFNACFGFVVKPWPVVTSLQCCRPCKRYKCLVESFWIFGLLLPKQKFWVEDLRLELEIPPSQWLCVCPRRIHKGRYPRWRPWKCPKSREIVELAERKKHKMTRNDIYSL